MIMIQLKFLHTYFFILIPFFKPSLIILCMRFSTLYPISPYLRTSAIIARLDFSILHNPVCNKCLI